MKKTEFLYDIFECVNYGSVLKNKQVIELFIDSIGEMKCKCMLAVDTLWKDNNWLIYGYEPNDLKVICKADNYFNKKMCHVESIDGKKSIDIPVSEIFELDIRSACNITLFK